MADLDGAWTLRLYPFEEDRRFFEEKPFKVIFRRVSCSRSRSSSGFDTVFKTVAPHLRCEFWPWLSYCLGTELLSNSAENTEDLLVRGHMLFVQVLLLRFQHDGGAEGDRQALAHLVEAQKVYLRAYVSVPADFCWLDDLDARDSWDDEPEGEPSVSDLDCVSDSDSEYVPEDLEVIPADDPRELDVLDFVQEEVLSWPRALPRQVPEALDEEWERPFRWCTHIIDFFFLDTDDGEDDFRDKAHVVDDLVEMRLLSERTYRSTEFQLAIEESGLVEALREVRRAGNRTHPDVEESFRFHNWKYSYGRLLSDWGKATTTHEDFDSIPNPDFPFDPMEFLLFFSVYSEMHPWRHNPMAAYLFLSMSSFKMNCGIWLVPALRELNYKTEGWDSEHVFRTLRAHEIFTDPAGSAPLLDFLHPQLRVAVLESVVHQRLVRKVHRQVGHRRREDEIASDLDYESHEAENHLSKEPSVSSPSSNLPFALPAAMSPSTSSTLTSALRTKTASTTKGTRRKARYRAKQSAHQGVVAKDAVLGRQAVPGGTWRYLAAGSAPVVHLRGTLHPNQVGIKAGVRTPQGCCSDVCPAKRSTATQAPGSKAPRPRTRVIKYVHPFDDLHMESIEHRPEVFRRCGRDIVRFFYPNPEKGNTKEFVITSSLPASCGETDTSQVGGVRFRALSRKVLELLPHNHRLIRIRSVKRREAMQAWAYGTMTPAGSRQAAGGRRGDTYGPYSDQNGDSADDIRALFRHATDADILVEVGTTIHPEMKSEVTKLSEATELNRLGRHGLSTFNCKNYISAVHEDEDVGVDDLTAPSIDHPKQKNSKKKKKKPASLGNQGGFYPCLQEDKKIAAHMITILRWVFNGRHAHATVMPSQSAVNANAQSTGRHATVRRRDAEQAILGAVKPPNEIPEMCKRPSTSPVSYNGELEYIMFLHSVPVCHSMLEYRNSLVRHVAVPMSNASQTPRRYKPHPDKPRPRVVIQRSNKLASQRCAPACAAVWTEVISSVLGAAKGNVRNATATDEVTAIVLPLPKVSQSTNVIHITLTTTAELMKARKRSPTPAYTPEQGSLACISNPNPSMNSHIQVARITGVVGTLSVDKVTKGTEPKIQLSRFLKITKNSSAHSKVKTGVCRDRRDHRAVRYTVEQRHESGYNPGDILVTTAFSPWNGREDVVILKPVNLIDPAPLSTT
ncbi:hypothetical protein B0H11DRAFT_1919802 [Mycena galericulata]|nr:hypothetical protein B0H11DRAFT_1919802 [Mycena galericulata]